MFKDPGHHLTVTIFFFKPSVNFFLHDPLCFDKKFNCSIQTGLYYYVPTASSYGGGGGGGVPWSL